VRNSRWAPTAERSICTPRWAPEVSVTANVSLSPARNPSGWSVHPSAGMKTRIGAPRLTIATTRSVGSSRRRVKLPVRSS
jgi:hypothetical protein